jgi:glycosyltransferase involved in cell wall biosynthesis
MTDPERAELRVAIIHYWLVGMRGGEKVLESLCRMYPQATIFTHVHVPGKTSDLINGHVIERTFISRLPAAERFYQKYLPLMPLALEQLDLSGFDLVISSESGPAKGVIVPPEARHLCYCHSPMRYIWDQYPTYRQSAGLATRAMMPVLAHRLRQWDVTSAQRIDRVVANSSYVARRVNAYWNRPCSIVHPPVDTSAFSPAAPNEVDDFYLLAGDLAFYKRPDLAVEAFGRLKKRLVVIGGPEKTRRQLEKTASAHVTFLGRTDFATLRQHLARCKALIFPGVEDFGIIPLEAMASGRPVIALGKGGALDTVVPGKTGVLFPEQTVESLIDAVERFEALGASAFDPDVLVDHAAQFSEPRFRQAMAARIEECMGAGGSGLDAPGA